MLEAVTLRSLAPKLSPVNMKDKFKIAVLGAGHGGLAMAGHLALKGFPVHLYNRSEKRIWGVISTGGIEMVGEEVEGFGAVKLATTSVEEAIRDVPLIMVAVPATGHHDIAELAVRLRAA